MKKIILFSLILFCSVTFGQKLVVTPNGLRDSTDLEKTYIVINIEGKTAKELYENAIKYINQNYKSPNDVIKGKTEAEFLSFNTHVNSLFTTKIMGYNRTFQANYITQLNFKDNKVKYEILNLDMDVQGWRFAFIETSSMSSNYKAGIYTKDLEIKRPEVKIAIEDYFKAQINALTEGLNDKIKNDNW